MYYCLASIYSGSGQKCAYAFSRTASVTTSSLLRRRSALSRLHSTTSEGTSDVDVDYSNENNRNDQVFSAMSSCGGIKVTVATTRNLVNEFMMMHTMNPVPADALGRAVTCTLLMSNGMQAEQTLQVTIQGDGALRGVCAISDGSGGVRGYVGNNQLNNIPLQEAVGKGSVQVVKMHPDWPNPYNGITAIRNGNIDLDIGSYLAESEQRSCALAAATNINGILCTAAGGYLVEQLPDCDEDVMKTVEANLEKVVAKDGGQSVPTNLLLGGASPFEIADQVLEGLDMKPLGSITPGMICKCSEERLIRSIRLLPETDVEEILSEHGKIEAKCEFCSKVYSIGPDRMRKIIQDAKIDAAVYKEDI